MADQPNKNGHIYPKETLEQSIKMADFPIIGQIGMSSELNMDLSKVSHQIDALWLDGSELKARVKILDNQNGHLLNSIRDDVAFRTSGTCKFDIDENGNKIIRDFKIMSVSAVLKEDAA